MTSWPLLPQFIEPEVPLRTYPEWRLPVAFAPTIDTLLRVATDHAPAAANDFPERILGPWALALDAADPCERAVLRWAVAAACFVNPDDDLQSPAEHWYRREPFPPVEERHAVRAVERTPWRVWRVSNEGFVDLQTGMLREVVSSEIVPWPKTPPSRVWSKVFRTVQGEVASLSLGIPNILTDDQVLENLPARDPGKAHLDIRRCLQLAWKLTFPTSTTASQVF